MLVLIVLALAGLLWLVMGDGSGGDDTADGQTQGESSDGTRNATRDHGNRGVIDPTAASGRVTKSADGSVIEGAVVVLTSSDEDADPIVARTDADGAWSVEDLQPGEYAVSATAKGFLAAVEPRIELESGKARAGIDLQLATGGSHFHGSVRDVTGGGIDGALVKVTPVDGVLSMLARKGFSTLTGADGTYSMQVADGRHRVSVWHPDYAAAQRVIEFKAGDREQDFRLTPMAIIEGVVLSEKTGQGVPGAKVRWKREQMVTIMPGQRMAMPVGMGAVVADESGKFRIRGLEPGTLTLTASGEGLASPDETTVDLGIAEQKTGVQLVLGAAHFVRGRVVVQGNPELGIAGARVSVRAAGMDAPGAESDAEGYFVVHGLLPGRYRLSAMAKGYAPQMDGASIEVEADVEDVLLELDAGLAVTGRVEPPEAAEVAVELRPEDVETGAGMGMFMMQSASTTANAEDGSFALRPVKPGKLTLVARADDGRMGEVSLDVGSEGATDVVITLEKRASVSGVVVDASGQAVTDATVSFKRAASVNTQVIVNGRDLGSDIAPTDENGAFKVTGLAAGDYEMSVNDSGGDALAWADLQDPRAAGRPKPYTVAGASDQTGVRLVVESRDGVITGTVKTAEGEPAPEIWVSAALGPSKEPEPEPQEGGTKSKMVMMMVSDHGGGLTTKSTPPVLTDEDGRFEITGLKSGEYELIADAKGSGARGTVDGVTPGQDVVIPLEPMGGVHGEVSSSGSPVKDYVVRVEGLASRTKRVRDDSGRYDIDRLEPGTYTVSVTAGSGSKTEKIEVEAGKSAELNVQLDGFATVTATVLDKEGNPVKGARVLMAEGDGRSISLEMDGSEADIRTNEKGEVRTKCAPGKRVLMIMAPEEMRPIAIKPFVAEAGQKVELGEIREQEMGGKMMMAEVDEEEAETP
jgi:hypothetical protein